MDKKILIGQVDSWQGIKNDTTNEVEYSFLYIVSKIKQNGLPELMTIPMYDWDLEEVDELSECEKQILEKEGEEALARYQGRI